MTERKTEKVSEKIGGEVYVDGLVVGPHMVREYRARIAELENALKPFADAAEKAAWPTFKKNNYLVDDSFYLTVKHLREARRAHSPYATQPVR